MKRNYTKLLVIAVLLIIMPWANTLARTVVVSVANFDFAPTSITDVVVGDIIRWEWVSGSHTTTSTSVPAGAATWDRPITTGSPSFQYTITVAGVYNYKCTPHAAGGMVASFTASVITGIEENTSIFGNLLLSPNPAGEFVRVSINPSSPFKGSVKLFDLLGNTLWNSEADFEAGLNLTEINLTYIPKGVYFVALSDNRNNRVVKRLIIR